MTVASQSCVVDYVGDGVTTRFDIPFDVRSPDHLRVLRVYPDGSTDSLTEYCRIDLENMRVDFDFAPYAGWTIRLLRVVPLEQNLDLQQQGSYHPEAIETALDLIVQMIQGLNAGVVQVDPKNVSVDPTTVKTLDGVPLFKEKVGGELRFRGLEAGSFIGLELKENTLRVYVLPMGPEDVGAAPAGHVGSTTGHPKATATNDGLMPKELVAKLAGIEDGANAYGHPATHPADMIVQTTSRQFVSFDQKTAWNAAAAHAGTTGNPHGLTREDIGAASQSDLTNHVNDKNNPHDVTAAQLDAATTGQLATVASNLATHAAGRNSHGTTAADVGAPTLADHAALEGRVGVLEGRPLGGTFIYDSSNGGWTSPNARGVVDTAAEPDAGVAEVLLVPAFATKEKYLVTVTPHLHPEKVCVMPQVEKSADRVWVWLLNAESTPLPNTSFDIVIHPL